MYEKEIVVIDVGVFVGNIFKWVEFIKVWVNDIGIFRENTFGYKLFMRAVGT